MQYPPYSTLLPCFFEVCGEGRGKRGGRKLLPQQNLAKQTPFFGLISRLKLHFTYEVYQYMYRYSVYSQFR